MALKTTHLLKDDPATADEFGTHKAVADLIRDVILQSNEGRSIALVGDWGSGKSTIIELLKGDFEGGNAASTHLFIYDAWSHQGDSLRRAFLDDFIASLKSQLTEKEVAEATDQVWNRTETTTATKEPVLRRHAKVLLLSLALIPLGMKLFDIPATTELMEGLGQCRNILAYLFLLAPVLAVAVFGFINCTNWEPIKDFLFGDSHKEDGFSVLSFFFEKVQGHVERKHIKTPVDSIRAFRDVFSQLVDNIHTRNTELRVIIIIDNIDRIPPDQARNFWSTMQTFFGDGGGPRRPQTRKYWLIAPFSLEALSSLFWDSVLAEGATSDVQAEPRAKAKAYIDKTFGLTFYVPPPILANWRRYLLDKLKESFPEHDLRDLISVRDVFDFGYSGRAIMPREMKLFVNGLVSLYRQRGDEISLATMAIYILHRDKIVGTEINSELLSPRECRVVGEADWRVPVAALHFGVSLHDATQILLREPILTALREGSKNKLQELEGRPGFIDVLQQVAIDEFESPNAENGTVLAQMAVTIGGLESASKQELMGVWRNIHDRLRTAKNWDGLQASTAEGIGVALTHIAGPEKSMLCEAVATSLSRAEIADPERDFQEVYAVAENWLRATKVIVDSEGAQRVPKIGLPGSPRLKLELLQQLAEMDAPDDFKTVYKVDVSDDELSKALAEEISAARFPRVQVTLVSLLVEKMKIGIQWQIIVDACAARLRGASVSAKETQSLVNLLLAARTIGGFADSLNTLKDLSTQGHLSHLIQRHQKNPAAYATVVAAIMLANPAFNRPNQIEQSQAGDKIFNELLGAENFDSDQIKSIAAIIRSVRADSILFNMGAKNKKIAKLAAAVIDELTRISYQFGIDPKSIIEQRRFLEAHLDISRITAFLSNLSKATDVLALLAAQPFEVDQARFYRATIGIASGSQGDSYLSFLVDGILDLEQSQWDQCLNTGNGPYFELLELAGDLRKLKEAFELSTPARDAALEQIRKTGRGEPAPSEEARERLSKILRLLPENLRSSLMRDVVEDMAGHADPVQITRVIELVGDHVTPEEGNDPDRIVRRILTPIVGNPTERNTAWMATIVERRLEFFRRLPEERKNEFGSRLRTAVQNKESVGTAVIESLTNIAGLLDISLSPSDGDSSGNPTPEGETP